MNLIAKRTCLTHLEKDLMFGWDGGSGRLGFGFSTQKQLSDSHTTSMKRRQVNPILRYFELKVKVGRMGETQL
jgi:hypothetical protein